MRPRLAHAPSWCLRMKPGRRTSHQIWKIVGREIMLSGQHFTVVGVTKPGQLLPGDDNVGFWAPLTMASAFQGADPWQERTTPALSMVGRLRTSGTQDSMVVARFSGMRVASEATRIRRGAAFVPLGKRCRSHVSNHALLFADLVTCRCSGDSRPTRHERRAGIASTHQGPGQARMTGT
jgi:hypothetical protein